MAYDPTPADISRARSVGRHAALARGLTWLTDDFESAALLGLAQACATFDPGRGVRFRTHAWDRVRGAVVDYMRLEMPKGFRRPATARGGRGGRREGRQLAAPVVRSLAAPLAGVGDEPVTGLDLVPDRGPPVGAAIDFADELAGLARRLPVTYQRLFMMFFGGAATMCAAAAGAGVDESLVSRHVGRATGWLAGRFGSADGVFMGGRALRYSGERVTAGAKGSKGGEP